MQSDKNGKEYVHLVSKDDSHFYIEKIVADQSAFLKRKIEEDSISNPITIPEIRGEILEIVVDYLNNKYYYENLVDIKKAPKEYKVKDELALEVLIASNMLEI